MPILGINDSAQQMNTNLLEQGGRARRQGGGWAGMTPM